MTEPRRITVTEPRHDEADFYRLAYKSLLEDWTELNRLLNHYSVARGWCTTYDALLNSFNRRWKTPGLRLLSRQPRDNQPALHYPDDWKL